MTNEKSSMNVYKQINWKIMIPIMLFVTFQSAFTAFSSVLASIAEQFPHASATIHSDGTDTAIHHEYSGFPVCRLAGILLYEETDDRILAGAWQRA